MGDVNLIPAARMARVRRRTRLYLWTAVCAVYFILLVAGSMTFRVLHASENRRVSGELDAITRQVEQGNHAMLELRRALAETATELETTKAVHRQPDWSRLLMGLSDRLGDEIVLGRCQLVTVTQDNKTLAGSETDAITAKPLGVFLAECRHKLTLTGFGRTQESVSRFILRLEGAGLFDTVRLASCSRQSFLSGEAVAFSVECRF